MGYLAGIHSHAQQNAHNLLKPCSYGAVDEFVRVAAFSKWINHVLTKSTLMYDRTALRRSSFEDVMPKKKPGSHQWPWHHQFAHRRRTHMPRKGTPRAVPGVQNTCRRQVKHFVRPFLRQVELQLCGATRVLQFPVEFMAPNFNKKIGALLKVQNRGLNGKKRGGRRSRRTTVSMIMQKALNAMLVQMYHKLYRTINSTNKLYKKDIPNMLAKIELVRRKADRRYRGAARTKVRHWKKDHPARISSALGRRTQASLATIAMPTALISTKAKEDAWQQ